jgi:hypothetical protein
MSYSKGKDSFLKIDLRKSSRLDEEQGQPQHSLAEHSLHLEVGLAFYFLHSTVALRICDTYLSKP